MLVVISLSFTIADRPPAPRFPDGFADTTLDSSRWDTSTLAVDDLTIGVALPPGWMRASAVGEAVLTLNRADANFAIELSIRRLAAPRTRIAGAPTNGQLQDMRESLQRRFNADGRRAAVLSSGQFSLERRFWAWGQMSVADAAPATRQASVWWFGTDDGDDVVGVIVTVQTRPGAAPDLRSAVSTSVAPTIVEFLKRLTIAR
jgi:hypothetical protein